MILVQFQNVYKEYNGEKLFAPFTFHINEKERIAIIGPNGTGKSNLSRVIMGDSRYELVSGEILFDGKVQGILDMKDLASHTSRHGG